MADRHGIYVASRASVPRHPAMWRQLRSVGWPIISSWIDEAGPGETVSQSDLWSRVVREVSSAERLILYAEPTDFPLKGAFIEVGIALGCGVPAFCVLPGVVLDENFRPLGSWINHPLVTLCSTLSEARETKRRIVGERITARLDTVWLPEDIALRPNARCRFCGKPITLGQFIVHLKDNSVAHDLCNEDAAASGAYV